MFSECVEFPLDARGPEVLTVLLKAYTLLILSAVCMGNVVGRVSGGPPSTYTYCVYFIF